MKNEKNVWMSDAEYSRHAVESIWEAGITDYLQLHQLMSREYLMAYTPENTSELTLKLSSASTGRT